MDMIRRLFLKCFVFICVYIIRPENAVFTEAYPNYLSQRPTNRLRHNNNPPAKWALDVIRDKISLSGLEDIEPGFNLTKEEMVKFKIWPQGIIPYYIDDFSFDKVLRDKIRNYLDLTNSATGLRFTELPRPPADEKTRWVLFVNRQGLLHCADHSINDFTNEGVQKVILGYDCLVTGGELAEAILALVGVPPQHNAPGRDEYIKIAKKNIIEGKEHLFTALKDTDWLFHDVPYDFLSASHYGFHKYTKNGFATIKLTTPVNVNIDEVEGFSYNDIWKIRMLYNYISNNKRNSIKFSDCMKLFEPGANFSQYKPFLEESIQPRTKPNKYLGLPEVNFTKTDNQTKPEDKPESNKDDKEGNSSIEGSGDEEEEVQHDNKGGEKEKNIKKENGDEEAEEQNDNKRGENEKNTKIEGEDAMSKEGNAQSLREEDDEKSQEVNNGKSKVVKLKNVKFRDPFSDLSDYKSSETTKTFHKRSFGKIKG